MGMSAASAATFSMVPSKRLTTAAAMNAVTRLMPNHTSRRRVEGMTPANTSSSSPQAGRRHDFVRGFFADDVDDVVDGDAAQQLAVLIDHGGGHQVAVLEELHHVVRIGFRRDARRLRVEDVADGFFRVFGQQPRERERAEVAIVAIDHEQAVGLVRQFRRACAGSAARLPR